MLSLKGVTVLIKLNILKSFVLEVGTRFLQATSQHLAKWIKTRCIYNYHIPEVPVYIEFFQSRDHIVDEKGFGKIY